MEADDIGTIDDDDVVDPLLDEEHSIEYFRHKV